MSNCVCYDRCWQREQEKETTTLDGFNLVKSVVDLNAVKVIRSGEKTKNSNNIYLTLIFCIII